MLGYLGQGHDFVSKYEFEKFQKDKEEKERERTFTLYDESSSAFCQSAKAYDFHDCSCQYCRNDREPRNYESTHICTWV
jgi:hypothetical protein